MIVSYKRPIPQVDPEILNIIDKGELNYWLSKLASKFARKKIQEIIKLKNVGTIFHPIILVDILKNKFEFSSTALLEIKFKLVERRNFMSSETVKLQRGLLRELNFINFFPFGFVCIKSLSRGIYLHICID